MVPLTLTLMQLCEYIVMQLYETYQNTKLGVLADHQILHVATRIQNCGGGMVAGTAKKLTN